MAERIFLRPGTMAEIMAAVRNHRPHNVSVAGIEWSEKWSGVLVATVSGWSIRVLWSRIADDNECVEWRWTAWLDANSISVSASSKINAVTRKEAATTAVAFVRQWERSGAFSFCETGGGEDG